MIESLLLRFIFVYAFIVRVVNYVVIIWQSYSGSLPSSAYHPYSTEMSQRYSTDPSLSSANHTSNNPAILLNEHGPRRTTDPVELRQLVLDYLCHQCFVDTASAFARESAASSNGRPAESTPRASNHSSQNRLSTGQLSQSAVAVKDMVIERIVRFDTDDDGDAEMGDVMDGSRTPQEPSRSAPHGAPSVPESAPSHAANVASGSSRQELADDRDDSSSHRPPWAGSAEYYSDWTAYDVHTTRVRLVIKDHIINGRIKEAVKLIESHFPAVLSSSLMARSGGSLLLGSSSTNSHSTKPFAKNPRFKSNRTAFPHRPLSGSTSTNSRSHHHGVLKPPNSSSGSPNGSAYNLRQGLLSKSNDSNAFLPNNDSKSSFMISHQSHQYPHAIFGSLNPAHVALNLQIQFFVEFVRSISQAQTTPTPHGVGLNGGFDHDSVENCTRGSSAGIVPDNSVANGKISENAARKPSASSPSNNSCSFGSSTNGVNDLSNSVGALSDDTSTTSSSVSTRTTSLALSLPHCRALHDFVHQLPEPLERAIFAKELENVAGLLAYVDPWDSPVRKYLDQSRRDSLAERVNAAILVHLGRSPTSILQLVAQQTCFTWSMLNELGERIPCPTADDKSRSKPSNFFNLHEFVNLHDLGSSHSNHDPGNSTNYSSL